MSAHNLKLAGVMEYWSIGVLMLFGLILHISDLDTKHQTQNTKY